MNSCLRATFLAKSRWSRGILIAIFTLASWALPSMLSPPRSAIAVDAGIDLLQLLQATESREAASQELGSYGYPNPETMLQEQQPLWPFYSFLWAEIYRLRGDAAQARKIFQKLVEWSAEDRYRDGWGGSGLAVVALWRWLSLANTNTDVSQQEKENLLAQISKFWQDQPRLGRGMFQTLPWLSALPQLKENLLRQTSLLARRLNQKEDAQRFFIEFLNVTTTGQLTEEEQELLAKATSVGIFSMPKIALTLGTRLQKLGEYEGASHWLTKALATGKSQVRAEASLSLARLRRIHYRNRSEPCLPKGVRELLATAINESTDPEVIQEALFHRAKVAIREGCDKDYSLFQKDLQHILKDFPQGRLADDALYQLAAYHLDRYRDLEDSHDLDTALRLFAQLRQDYPYREDHIDSSWFKPAIALYAGGNPAELQQAATLLRELEKARPDGPFHLGALFWLGRIAEETGDEEEAKAFFAAIIKECPYDYYATRARMHLHLGNQAAKQFNPDTKTREELKTAYQRSKEQPPAFEEKSPYHLRLQAAVQSGLYYRSLRSYIDFRKNEFPASRLETIPLDGLDRSNRLTHIALMLALRQDALAATDTPPNPRNRLAVAKTLSHFSSPDWPFGDWPLVIYISCAADRPYEVRCKTQNDPGYLAVAYPKNFAPLIDKYSGADLPGALLYAVIRHESAFETTALSPAGGLGLFQFIPRTFKTLDERYKVLNKRRKESRTEFLLNPEDSIYLGALWFRKELYRTQGKNLLWALMEHNAGLPAVKEWKTKWRDWSRIGDYEFMVDAVRFAETRTFVRGVINTYWIVEAASLY